MSKDFDECVECGGKVVTKNLKGGRYMQICYDKDGSSYKSEIKKNKKREKKEDNKDIGQRLQELKAHFDEHYHN